MSNVSSPRTGSSGELFVSADPEAVGDWCRAQLSPGCVFVAPSASARRRTLRAIAAARGVTLGHTIVLPGHLLSLLESRAGLGKPRMMPAALARMLVVQAARDAGLALFVDRAYDPPAGAIRAVGRLFAALRSNRVSADQYVAAGGDPLAADAFTRYETERIARHFQDDTDRVDRLLHNGVPRCALVMQEPQIAHRAAGDLLAAAIAASSSCHVGLADLGAYAGTPPTVAFLEAAGLRVSRDGTATMMTPTMRAVGGVGSLDEAELVARHIRALITPTTGESTVPASEILAVAPTSAYLALLADACARIGVPIASPRRIRVADIALVRAVMETCTLLANEGEDSPERGLALLATPYLGLSLHEHDRLARKLVLRGLGSLRSWRQLAPTLQRPKFQHFAEHVEVLARQFTGERAPLELARVVTSLGLDHGFLSAGRRALLDGDRDDDVRLDQQGWDALTDAIEELNDSVRELGMTRVSTRWWLRELAASLAERVVRVEARDVNGVHLAVSVSGIARARHVFALGWREGLVPRRVRDEPLLADGVKRALNARGARFVVATDRTAVDAERRDRIRWAAAESLTVSWPAVDEDGGPMLASFYLDDLAITERTTRGVGDTTWRSTLTATRGERLARATFVAHHRTRSEAGDELPLVRDALAALTVDEQRSYRAERHAPQTVALPPDTLATLVPLAGRMSATQAHAVAHCLYEHFGTRRLGVAPLRAPTVDMRLLGTIAHLTLSTLGPLGFDPECFDAAFARIWDEQIIRTLADENATTFERSILERNLRALVEGEHALLQQVAARPTYFELGFGENQGRDPASRTEGVALSLPSDAALTKSVLRGAIDRVDVLVRDGTRYGVAIDYKLGNGQTNFKEMNESADFQLPIYCDVLPSFGIEPVGAYFLGVSSQERYGIIRSDFRDDFLPTDKTGIRTVSPEDFTTYMAARREALSGEIARLTLGTLVAKPRLDDCKFCDLRPLCRIGTFGVGMTSSDD